MILTVTANSVVDQAIFIDRFEPGTTMRSRRVVLCVGGKGCCTSVALRCLGLETMALVFLAGAAGRELLQALDGYGIAHNAVWVDGETRRGVIIVETDLHRQSHIMTGALRVSSASLAELWVRYREDLKTAQWVVAAGSLAADVPVTFYRTLVEMAHEAGVPILLDCTGEPAREALPARPTILKMNWAEFAETFGLPRMHTADLGAQAQQIVAKEYLPALVISCGAEGIVACTEEGAYLAQAPVQRAVNAAGAGDAASAALAWRLSVGDAWPAALRWTAAVSAATVLTEAAAESRMADSERLWRDTIVTELV